MRFELWRQDDNRNVFRIGEYASREKAEERMAELTHTPHKQTYWIEEEVQTKGMVGR
jgi:hypothetical protein